MFPVAGVVSFIVPSPYTTNGFRSEIFSHQSPVKAFTVFNNLQNGVKIRPTLFTLTQFHASLGTNKLSTSAIKLEEKMIW